MENGSLSGHEGERRGPDENSCSDNQNDAKKSAPPTPTVLGEPRKPGTMMPPPEPQPSDTPSTPSAPSPPFIKQEPGSTSPVLSPSSSPASTTTPSLQPPLMTHAPSIAAPPIAPGKAAGKGPKGAADVKPVLLPKSSSASSAASSKFMPSLAKAKKAAQLRLEKEAKIKSEYENDVIMTEAHADKDSRKKKERQFQQTTASGPWAQGPAAKATSKKPAGNIVGGGGRASNVIVKSEPGLESAGFGLMGKTAAKRGVGGNLTFGTNAYGDQDEQDEYDGLYAAFRGLDLEDDVTPDILDPLVIRARREHLAERLKKSRMDVSMMEEENGQVNYVDDQWPGNDDEIACEDLKHHGKFGFWAMPSKLPVPLKNALGRASDDGVVVKKEKGSGGDVKVKAEPGFSNSTSAGSSNILPPKKRENPPPQGGQIGKVVTRRSGKMELHLGDYIFDLTNAPPAEFLQKVALFEMGDTGDFAEGFLLGDVGNRYVVSPSIEYLLQRVNVSV
ncbi:hypothetical protein SeMB42_g02027 [Synchytrium endobioticum]|uniref:DNA-directed RNA polymerase III subunit RPC4 n=1 Tax=Synchytrium endobioticum TaxID=286115 RepID=A0A507DIM5_9FUNG|nr:hypothetical protein SeLEV6574_g02292 [Synchytrium endobioticum]TPX51135.1 hypothetical protein SeMB42_g02027 [Synchytrium endobioticum]